MLAAESPAGRFVPARSFEPDREPATGATSHLLRDGLRPVRQRQDGAEAADQPLQPGPDHRHRVAGNPLLNQTATLQWRDVNGDDIAQGERVADPSVVEINFGQLPTTSRSRRLPPMENTQDNGEPRAGRRDPARACPTSRWRWMSAFKDLTVSLNQSWSTADYTPYTLCDPLTGEPFTAYGRSAAAQARPSRCLDTYDPERKRQYKAFNLEFRYRPYAALSCSAVARSSGCARRSVRAGRSRTTCPSPPRSRRRSSTPSVCATRPSSTSRGGRRASCRPLPVGWGSRCTALRSNVPSPQNPSISSRRFTATRAPAARACPSPCPAGQVVPPPSCAAEHDLQPRCRERVTRTDHARLQVSRTFRLNRMSIIDVRGVQREQLGRDHQLRDDQCPELLVPGPQQHHAGPAMPASGLMVRW